MAQGFIRIIALFALLFASTYTAAAQKDLRPPREADLKRLLNVAQSGTIPVCLTGSAMYDVNNFSSTLLLQNPFPMADVDPGQGYINWRLLTSPPFMDLAWAADFKLYGVTNSAITGPDANALFRVDAVTGATTRIGSTGMSMLDGDLATHPTSGMVYGVTGNRLFLFNGLTANASSPAVTPLNPLIALPSGSALIGLAFDPSGGLFAISQPAVGAQRGALLKLDPATRNIISSVPLSRRVGSHGGMEIVGNRIFFAEGNKPGAQPENLGDERIWEINRTTGAVTFTDFASLLNGFASLVTCEPQLQICRPPPPDMVAWYTLDANANDKIMGNNAVPSGTASFLSNGKVGGSVQFAAGAGGYLTIPPGPLLNQGLGDFSIDAWIVVYGNGGTVIDKRATLNGEYRGYALFTGGNRLALQLADGNYSNYYDSRVMTTGWHHIAVTVDRDNPQGVVFYVDGVPGTPFNPIARQGNLDNNAPTYIGRHAFDGSLSKFLRVDEIEFFDRALTAPEIASIYKAGTWGKCK